MSPSMPRDDIVVPRRDTRGKVVMLVDNDISGDSRVQKQARSAAEAGWDVVLLGKSPDGEQHTWALGDATVLLIPVSRAMSKARYVFRRAPLRRPLAYPPGRLAAYRKQQVKARRGDLRQRRALLAAGEATVTLDRLLLALAIATNTVTRRWVSIRFGQTQSLREARTMMDSPLDRLTTAFWIATMGDRAWRRLDPHLWDYEIAFGNVVDRLSPDLIHANDFRMLGVGARARVRAHELGLGTKLVWDAHEFLPGIKPWVDQRRWHLAQCAHEREHAPYADAVVTVSETLADLLVAEHGLTNRPTVVLNTPSAKTDATDATRVADLRGLCGIGADMPLAVYSGAAAPQRGLNIMVESLPRLPGLHVALVVGRPESPYVKELQTAAAELGVGERVHVLPYVVHDQVVRFLSSADVGVIPIHRWPNHEIALITKFFEYSHARLPIVVSDVKTMAEMTLMTGQGEVFRVDDLDDYVRAVQAVLAHPERYRAAYDAPGLLDGWTWEAQAAVLDGVYSQLLPDHPAALAPVEPSLDLHREPIGSRESRESA
jgi:glycogen(starch) synthase